MKHHCKKIATLASTILLATILASCGGGGAVPAASLTYQDIVTTIPTPPATYTTDEANVLAQLTAIRQAAGYLTPNTDLDRAATNHVNFLITNNLLNSSMNPGYLTTIFGGILGGHYENSTLPGYTGASPQTRATAAGYAGTVSETMIFAAADGTNCVDLMGDSVYHVIDLISPFIDLGISFNAGGSGNSSACAIEMGVGNNTLGQLPASAPVVYPYDTQTSVLPKFYNQAEDPVPAPDLPFAGHPIVVSLYMRASSTLNGNDIIIHTFSVTPSLGGGALAARVLANAGVTSDGPPLSVDSIIPRPGFVVLLPTSPLNPSTMYNVSFNATVKGLAVSKTWSFTTGAAN
jgi:hypothetical protein